MIVLDSAYKRLELKLQSPATTIALQVVCSFDELKSADTFPFTVEPLLQGIAPVVIISTPPLDVQRRLKFLSIYNSDSVPAMVTLQLNDNGVTRVINKWLIAVGYSVVYNYDTGFTSYNTNGATQTSGGIVIVTLPLQYDAATATFSIQASSATVNGYLKAIDWNIFNNKQNAITLGTAAQYLKGDLTLGTFLTDARGAITLTTAGVGGAATYSAATGVLNIPNYISGVTSVFGRTGAVVAAINDYTFSQIGSTPTTIGGYGITDFNTLGDARWSLLSHTHTFASLTLKPTTISGYGITDAALDASVVHLAGAETITGAKIFNPSVTPVGGIARGINATPTLTATVNNDLLVGLDIAPTFTNGAFTGVGNVGVRSSNFRSSTGGSISNAAYQLAQSNLGLYSSATDRIDFVTAGVQRMSILGNGNIVMADNTVSVIGNNYIDYVTNTTGLKLTSSTVTLQASGTVGLTMFGTRNVKIEENNAAVDIPTSLFSVVGTTKGSIPAPIMTQTQRDAIATPATGLQVYNSTTNAINFYTGAAWASLGGGGGTITLSGEVTGSGTAAITTTIDKTISPTWTGAHRFNPSITAVAAIARGFYNTPTLVAAANNDVLVGLDVAPTFTNGAFTGVTNLAARFVNGIVLINSSAIIDTTSNLQVTGNIRVSGSIYTGLSAMNAAAGASLQLAHNGTTSTSANGVAQINFWSQYGNTPFTMGAEDNGYNFRIRQTNGGQGVFEFNFGTIATVPYSTAYAYTTDHYEQGYGGKWLLTYGGTGNSGAGFGVQGGVTSNDASLTYDTYKISSLINGGYYIKTNEPLITLFNGNSTGAITSANRPVARFNRMGFLGIGTDVINGTSNRGQQAGITVDITSRTGSDILGAVAQIKTVGSSTSATFLGTQNNMMGYGIMVGSKITANGITRTVVDMSDSSTVILDLAVDWSNAGVGFGFTYQNAFLSLQNGALKYLTVTATGIVLVGTGIDDGSGAKLQVTGTAKVSGLFTSYVAKTAVYTAIATDSTIDCTSGTFTVTLPTAVGITGRIFIVKNSGAGTITMAGTSAQTFDGVASPTIAAGIAAQYQSNNVNWIKIN